MHAGSLTLALTKIYNCSKIRKSKNRSLLKHRLHLMQTKLQELLIINLLQRVGSFVTVTCC